jgi:hypothetical protein
MAGMNAPVEVLDAARSGDAAAFERLKAIYEPKPAGQRSTGLGEAAHAKVRREGYRRTL